MSGFLGARSVPLRIASAVLFLAGCVALLGSGLLEKGRMRSVFFFPLSTSSDIAPSDAKLSAETRYLDIGDGEREPLCVYLSEYLLGSSEPGRAAPFASRCSVKRCFVRGDAAYIDLAPADSDQVLADPYFSYRCGLLEKNICTNFRNIDTIFLYFDGIEVYAKRH